MKSSLGGASIREHGTSQLESGNARIELIKLYRRADVSNNRISDPISEDDFVATALDLIESITKEQAKAGEIPYKKLGTCPSCGAKYMYTCTCDTASDYIEARQRERLAQLLGEKK